MEKSKRGGVPKPERLSQIRSYLTSHPNATYKEVASDLPFKLTTNDIAAAKRSITPRAGAPQPSTNGHESSYYSLMKGLAKLVKVHGVNKVDEGLRILKEVI